MPKPVTWSLSPEEALKRIRGRLFATVTETSVILGYDEAGRTVRKAIAAGDVPAVKAGSTYRVPVSWILQQARLGAPQQPDEAAGDDPELDAQRMKREARLRTQRQVRRLLRGPAS